MTRIPEVAAALVCQVVVTDMFSGSKSLTNIFSIFGTPMLPVATGFGLFVKMVDGEGEYALRIRFVRLRDERVVLDIPSQKVLWPDPAGPLEVALSFLQVPLEEEGAHEFQVFMDDIYVGRAPFVVKLLVAQIPGGGN